MSRLIICTIVVFSLTFVSPALAQQTLTKPKAPSEPSKQQRPQQGDMGDILIKGLKQVDGCIDVKTCQWSDGKRSIVAWFENKEAAVSWYYSSTHQAMVGGKTDGTMKKDDEPMMHIKDENQPLMVIATLTPARKPELPGIDIPISQISIELFAALPGGAQVGGRVSPIEFKVPHMRDYTQTEPKSIEGNGQPSKTKNR